jgi:calcium-dependent protein kinase
MGTNESIADYYLIDESLYAFGTKSVSRCIEKATGQRFVIKRRSKEGYTGDVERHWRRVMERLLRADPNRHIVAIYEILEDDVAFYIVMEECTGGQLFDLLLRESTMSTKELKRIIREILLAVEYLHDIGLIHRDIKPENIMLTNENGDSVIKLIDFDTCDEIVSRRLSVALTPGGPERLSRRKSTQIIGTLGYIAPESFNGEYSTASDLFAVGVIFFILITGDMPFDDSIFQARDPGEDDFESVDSPRAKRVHASLMNLHIDWDVNPWPQVPLARDLCQKLLELNPDKRLSSCEEALRHPWLSSVGVPATPSRSS